MDICSPVRLHCATKLHEFYQLFKSLTTNAEIHNRMIACARYLRTRQTTRLKDEPICVSTILSLDPSPLLALEKQEDRMERFYEIVGRFDPKIIFNNHPRLQTDGYRWAPESFLQQVPDPIIMREGGTEEIPLATLRPNGGGLFVQFPGFKLHNFEPNFDSSIFVVPRTVTIPREQKLMSPPKAWWNRWYSLKLLSDEKTGQPPVGLNPKEPKLQYAVIMYTDLHEDFLPAPAMLGTIGPAKEKCLETELKKVPKTELSQQLELSLTPNKPRLWLPIDIFPTRIAFRYICRALVDMPEQETLIGVKETYKARSDGKDQHQYMADGMHVVSATVYSRKQKWCIL